jgi:acetyl esterase
MSGVFASARDRIEGFAVRGLGKLPGGAQRLLAGGRPVRIDGQELAPEVQLLLKLDQIAGRPSFEELPVHEARKEIRREAFSVAGAPVSVARVEERSVRGAEGQLAARLYVPFGAPAPAPLLVYFHGGGWVVGDLDTHDQPCRFLAREAGALVLSIAYRLAPEHRFPAPVEDCLAALRSAIDEAPHLGADPARVGVGGDSAGANLAAAVAQLAASDGGPTPIFQLLIYPVTDLSRKRESYRLFREGFFLTESQMDWYRDHYLPDAGAALDPRASPILASDLSGLPPAHVVTAGFDPLRDEVEDYAAALRAAGVQTSLQRETGLIHGFTHTTAIGRAAHRAMTEVGAALRAGLEVPAASPASGVAPRSRART